MRSSQIALTLGICFVMLFSTVFGQNCLPVQKISVGQLSNLYKVSDDLYRSDQPLKLDMVELEKLGIKTVINLRNGVDDIDEAQGTSLKLIHIPMNARAIKYDEVVLCMKMIKDSPKPVLIHCLHGSDRTGCTVAAYRMIFCGWSREQAMEEFLKKELGYHKFWFPNIRKFLKKLDIDKLKAECI